MVISHSSLKNLSTLLNHHKRKALQFQRDVIRTSLEKKEIEDGEG